MTLKEIINSLRDQITDRESLIPKDEPDSIFADDAEALCEAVKLLTAYEGLTAGQDMTVVVRCKSCKFSKWNEKKKQRYCARKWTMYRVRERDYCSYGIKSTAGGRQT